MSDEKPTICPHCGADLVGEEIPEHERELFGGATHGSRLIGIYSTERDCTTHYQCPDCEGRIERPGWERYAAEPGWQERMDEAIIEFVRRRTGQ